MPPATATATATARRSPASARRAAVTVPGPRRISGPARTRKASTTPQPLAFRLVEAVHALSEHRLVDRLVRGRAWIAIVGVGLIGIVFMQVSMLRMNTGIGQAVERASTLERENAAMQANISQLSSSERIRNAAVRAGMIPATRRDGELPRRVEAQHDQGRQRDHRSGRDARARDDDAAFAAGERRRRDGPADAETRRGSPRHRRLPAPLRPRARRPRARRPRARRRRPARRRHDDAGTTTAGTRPRTTTQTPIPQPNPTASVAGGAAATGP